MDQIIAIVLKFLLSFKRDLLLSGQRQCKKLQWQLQSRMYVYHKRIWVKAAVL